LFGEILAHTVCWLKVEGFIRSFGNHPREEVLLTDKGLAATHTKLPDLSGPFGAELSDAVQDASSDEGRRKLGGLIGDFQTRILPPPRARMEPGEFVDEPRPPAPATSRPEAA
jgi:hypothetical protein